MPRQEYHRRFGSKRSKKAGGPIRVSLAAVDERDPRLPSEAPVSVGHVHARRFMACMDNLDVGIEQRVIDGHNVIARDPEDAANALALERAGHDARPAQRAG